MIRRFNSSLIFIALAATLSHARDGRYANGQEPTQADKSVTKPSQPTDAARALELLKEDVGVWKADVSLWFRPGAEPIRSRAVVSAQMSVGGKYLEQRFEGKFGPELGNTTWSTASFTRFDAGTGMYETVRMASSESPMIVVRGKGTSNDQGLGMELLGEYTLMGAKATERDIIRHEGSDKCVIESWMSFGASPEFKGAEMVLSRMQHTPSTETPATLGAGKKFGNFSVSLSVKDLSLSRAFYEKLGFRSIAGNGRDYLILQNDGSTIGLFHGMLDKNTLTFNPGWDRTGAPLAQFDDVRDIQRALKAQGIEILVSTDENATGPASISLVDPDGNPILLDQHVPKPE